MEIPIAIVIAAIFLSLSLLHVYWAFGGNWGIENAVPAINNRKVLQPSSSMTLLVALLLLLGMLNILGLIGWLGNYFPAKLFRYGAMLISLLFFLRAIGEFKYVGIFKKIKDTSFAYWDSRLFVPLCLIISLSTLFIFLSRK